VSDCSLTYRQAPAARLTREQPEAFNPIRVNVKVITSQGTQGQVNVPVKVSPIDPHLLHSHGLSSFPGSEPSRRSQGESRLRSESTSRSRCPACSSLRPLRLRASLRFWTPPRPKNPQKPQQLLIIAILCCHLRGAHSTPLQILPFAWLPEFAPERTHRKKIAL